MTADAPFQHPADGWYQIEAKGSHPNAAAGVLQVIDDEAASSIVNRFNADARAGKLRHGSEMLVDREHFSADPNKETVAYGWLLALQNRSDGIYGRIRWTNTGQAAVDGGEYRFFSTEYEPQDLKVLNGGSPKTIRPLRLGGLTLTNMHNNVGQKPITNRAAMITNRAAAPTEPYQLPAVQKWLDCVHSIRRTKGHGKLQMSAKTACELARKHFPDLHQAAFHPGNAAAPVDDCNLQDNSQKVAALANRIKETLHLSQFEALEIVRTQLPHIYNLALPQSKIILNRALAGGVSAANQKRAAELIGLLVEVEIVDTGMPHSMAFAALKNRRPALHLLAEGRISLNQAGLEDPDLMERLA